MLLYLPASKDQLEKTETTWIILFCAKTSKRVKWVYFIFQILLLFL